jgi:hypothetical protein
MASACATKNGGIQIAKHLGHVRNGSQSAPSFPPSGSHRDLHSAGRMIRIIRTGHSTAKNGARHDET